METEQSLPLALRGLRSEFSAEEIQAIDDLFSFGLSARDGKNQRKKAMGRRADRLRCIGNGVVDVQAAAALIELDRRLGTGLVRNPP